MLTHILLHTAVSRPIRFDSNSLRGDITFVFSFLSWVNGSWPWSWHADMQAVITRNGFEIIGWNYSLSPFTTNGSNRNGGTRHRCRTRIYDISTSTNALNSRILTLFSCMIYEYLSLPLYCHSRGAATGNQKVIN